MPLFPPELPLASPLFALPDEPELLPDPLVFAFDPLEVSAEEESPVSAESVPDVSAESEVSDPLVAESFDESDELEESELVSLSFASESEPESEFWFCESEPVSESELDFESLPRPESDPESDDEVLGCSAGPAEI